MLSSWGDLALVPTEGSACHPRHMCYSFTALSDSNTCSDSGERSTGDLYDTIQKTILCVVMPLLKEREKSEKKG